MLFIKTILIIFTFTMILTGTTMWKKDRNSIIVYIMFWLYMIYLLFLQISFYFTPNCIINKSYITKT